MRLFDLLSSKRWSQKYQFYYYPLPEFYQKDYKINGHSIRFVKIKVSNKFYIHTITSRLIEKEGSKVHESASRKFGPFDRDEADQEFLQKMRVLESELPSASLRPSG